MLKISDSVDKRKIDKKSEAKDKRDTRLSLEKALKDKTTNFRWLRKVEVPNKGTRSCFGDKKLEIKFKLAGPTMHIQVWKNDKHKLSTKVK